MRHLYVLGTLPQAGIAIVGSRTPPREAEEFAFALARGVRAPVVAGLALGIDTAAHRGAMEGGKPTVAFVGYGFGRTSPPENAALESEIVRAGGAIATLRPPGEEINAAAAIDRDRLQAEHAVAVVLVATEIDGGAMHTLAFAAELHKPQYAVVPPLASQGSPQWAGNLRALAGGAIPLPFSVEEALAILHERHF